MQIKLSEYLENRLAEMHKMGVSEKTIEKARITIKQLNADNPDWSVYLISEGDYEHGVELVNEKEGILIQFVTF